jgi:hypothetical protein
MKTEAWYSGNAYDGKAQSGLTLLPNTYFAAP